MPWYVLWQESIQFMIISPMTIRSGIIRIMTFHWVPLGYLTRHWIFVKTSAVLKSRVGSFQNFKFKFYPRPTSDWQNVQISKSAHSYFVGDLEKMQISLYPKSADFPKYPAIAVGTRHTRGRYQSYNTRVFAWAYRNGRRVRVGSSGGGDGVIAKTTTSSSSSSRT